MRAFLAIEVPPVVKDYLQSVISGMASRVKDIRWVKKGGLHITLRFLGDIEKDKAEQIREAVSVIRTAYSPFPASIEGIDAFPSRRRARVVVVTMKEGVSGIKNIFSDVERGLSTLNIEPEEREYTPHITLGRAKMPAPLLEKDIMPLEEKRFTVDGVVLFQSTLTKEGAVYTPVWDIKLGG